MTVCEIDLSAALVTKADSSEKRALALAKSQALVQWLNEFQLPALQRKLKEAVEVSNNERGRLCLEGDNPSEWEKKILASLKKVLAEDLGHMDAAELLPTIPDTDPEGRGLQDLRAIEKKLLVKVVFDNETGHVFLVGDGKKLEKKCFVLRNMLSHYHWRLTGKDAAFP